MELQELIATIKESKKHRYIYHFTDLSNIGTIKAYGLLSKEQQLVRNVLVSHPGGDQQSRISDQARGIYNDVSLCLTRNHPMAYRCRQDGRHPNQRYLGICPSILAQDGIKIALGLANSAATQILPIAEGISDLDYKIIYEWVNDFSVARLSAAEKIEILVPHGVPRNKIKRIFW